MSAGVTSSGRLSGRPKRAMIRLAAPLKAQTSGDSKRMQKAIGAAMRNAMASGATMATRLGSRSASRTKAAVTSAKERMEPSVAAVAGLPT